MTMLSKQPAFEETVLTRLKPQDEEGRIRALRTYDVLDTAPERPFENIVTLVGQILNVPMCAVTLVDTHRQWFKARRGLPEETARSVSFCSHAIRQPAPFVICDAREDSRFAENPLVTGEPFIRSYLGIPLRTPDGYNIGSLCAIDTKPRDWPEHEVNILVSFAKVVMDELELRRIANADMLTGAMTRRAWMEEAEKEIRRARRYGHPLSLAVIDLDRFKQVNDSHGHPAGDRVIQVMSALMMDRVRDQDAFGRYGGEEFVLLMPETDAAEAARLADRLRTAFQDLAIDLESGESIRCTCSIGVAALGDEDMVADLIDRADRCLYEAKKRGRNQVVHHGIAAAAAGGGA